MKDTETCNVTVSSTPEGNIDTLKKILYAFSILQHY